MEDRFLVDSTRAERMSAKELRAAFLVEGLFAPGEVKLLHWEAERTICGSAVPLGSALALVAPPELKATSFCARRELGVVNVGGAGRVTVDGAVHDLAHRDALYVGRGAKEVVFASGEAAKPALFYLVSYPCHASHPTMRVTQAEAETLRLGEPARANVRTLRRYVHPGAFPTGQLVMGVTDLDTGSVWNTMPPHRHARRTEIYLYFDLAPDAVAFHFMGRPGETRHLVVRNLQVALSPVWSMHFAAATSRYAFVWAMGGENQEFDDMQGVPLDAL